MPPTIRVLIADDQIICRAGLRTLLSLQPDINLVAEAANGQEAIDLAQQFRPDVILMDVQMPEVDGVQATKQVLADSPQCRVIILTTFVQDSYIFAGLKAGAIGYLLKDAGTEQLTSAIRAAFRGEASLHEAVTTRVVLEFNRLAGNHDDKASYPVDVPLTAREIEVIRLVALGQTNSEIGQRLNIETGSVKNHLTNVMAKLGAHNRASAAVRAKDLGLI
jgi:DNA-binding NarL/FixJ family response regulator